MCLLSSSVPTGERFSGWGRGSGRRRENHEGAGVPPAGCFQPHHAAFLQGRADHRAGATAQEGLALRPGGEQHAVSEQQADLSPRWWLFIAVHRLCPANLQTGMVSSLVCRSSGRSSAPGHHVSVSAAPARERGTHVSLTHQPLSIPWVCDSDSRCMKSVR